MQEVLSAVHSHPWSTSCWHLAANITAYSVHTDVNTAKQAFTRRQTHKSHTAEFSVWENADVLWLCITTTSHTELMIKLQRDCGAATHTHATLLRGLDVGEPGLQPNPVSRFWPRCSSRWETAILYCLGSKVRLNAQEVVVKGMLICCSSNM